MTGWKKRSFIIAGVVVIFLALAAAFFYRPTRLALERAESFAFRRLAVSLQKENGAFRFFFATNRTIANETLAPENQFGSQRQKEMSYGFFDTTIEPHLGLGMIINPTDWFQNEEIQILHTQKSSEEELVSQLTQQVNDSPHRSLLISVNGFREQFPSALRKTAFLSHVLDINTPHLVFDWPGNQGSTLRGYRQAQSIASASGAELAELLQIILTEVRPERLWLLANSMGAQVVVHALKDLADENRLADRALKIGHVVLTAPDVDVSLLDQLFREKVDQLAKHFTTYVSSNDRALLMSRLINRERRLGQSTLNPRNQGLDQSEEATALYDLLSPGDDLMTLVDVTPINRTRNFHNFSLETPEFFDDLFLRLLHENQVMSRSEYRVQGAAGRVYSVLTQAR
jgi:esterase/lipase superfamily enzyme